MGDTKVGGRAADRRGWGASAVQVGWAGAALLCLMAGCGGLAEVQNAYYDATGTKPPEPKAESAEAAEAKAGAEAGAESGATAQAAPKATPKAAPKAEEEEDSGFFGGLGGAMKAAGKVKGAINDSGAGAALGAFGVEVPGLDADGPGGGGGGGGQAGDGSATCCVNRQFYNCPGAAAAVRCLGKPMQLYKCSTACRDGDCNLKCVEQYGPDPSECAREPAKDNTCPAK